MAIQLDKAVGLLRDRVAEEGAEFWSDSNVVAYINLAQDYVASITRGVSEELVETVGKGASFFVLPPRTINAFQLSGFDVRTGEAMGTLSASDANLISPGWRSFRGVRPKWFIVDVDNRVAHVSPIPGRDTDVNLRVSVLPDPVAQDADLLFNGRDSMDKYLNVTINMGTVYAYLKERFDQEAERMYSFVVRELTELGSNPNSIPPFVDVREESQ